MYKIELLNLDLGKNIHFDRFQIGPFEIQLDEDYSTKRELILQGKNEVTAIASFSNNSENALLTFSPFESLEWDLCFILSFLTGRRLSFPGQERRFHYSGRGRLFIDERDLPDAANLCWQNRYRLREEKRPFWFYLDLNDTPVIQYKALLGCIALEIIQEIEAEDGDIPKQLQELTSLIMDNIDDSSIDNDLKGNLKSTVGKWGKSNYVSGLISVLQKYKIVTSKPQEFTLKRIKTINKIRNDIVHGNKIKYPDWIEGDEQRREKEYVFICTQFIPSIVKEYLIRVFNLEKFYGSITNRENLQEYIYHGTWQRRKINEIIR